jgi:hypothetical protein
MLVPGTDDVTVAMLMAGSGEVTPVEGEGGVGENPLVGQAVASSRDPGSVHPKQQNIVHCAIFSSLSMRTQLQNFRQLIHWPKIELLYLHNIVRRLR